RLTKLVVLGIAKVMSYKDLIAVREKRGKQDAAKEKGKGKRSRKRKTADGTVESGVEDSEQQKRTRKRQSATDEEPKDNKDHELY
ncbi:hypothetical protein DM02DRAFT_535640, partial [Periconia macrospinosa]